ncbi:MAG: isopeptide-forming domain-containing fimbrial protein, partial [Clostridia bacterium]|nr:isopeptide-forming domain-containing fimbrial protein [Clostridia bacterium]
NDENTVYNLALLQLTNKGTFDIRTKTDVPEIEKKVKDVNDSVANSTTGWQDSADHDINDNVSYQITVTLPTDLSSYDKYRIAVVDTISKGLTCNGDFTIMMGNENVTNKFKITHANAEDDAVQYAIVCDDIIDFVGDNTTFVITYTAELNENAVIGSAGNPNTVYLEYTNNPNWDGVGNSPNGKTPVDKVIVFTYKLDVNKVHQTNTDADGNPVYEPLEGAGFKLYKKDDKGVYKIVGDELKGEEMTTFTWVGLDDGEYKLVESTTPAGYNTIQDIEFTITAEHDILSDDPTLTDLEGGNKFTGAVLTGALTGEVINETGSILPETGGIGTTIFYALGAVMVIGAGVLLIAKKRMSNEV